MGPANRYNAQNIDEINKALEQTVQSRKQAGKTGHIYMRIDSKNQQIELTTDKKLASSMISINHFFYKYSKQVAEDRSIPRIEVKNLRHNFIHLSKAYVDKERSFFGKIFYIFSSYIAKFLRNETVYKLDQHLHNYQAGEQTLRYDKYAENIVNEKMAAEANINQFNKIKNNDYLNINLISKAFERELNKDIKTVFSRDKASFEYILGCFDDLLNQLSTQVEQGGITSQGAVNQFEAYLATQLLAKNTEHLEVDRETFKDLVGKRVDGGIGSKIPVSLGMTKEIKDLIAEYNDDTWVDKKDEKGEVINPRTITYDRIEEDQMGKISNALSKIINNEDFKATLVNYFSQVLADKTSKTPPLA